MTAHLLRSNSAKLHAHSHTRVHAHVHSHVHTHVHAHVYAHVCTNVYTHVKKVDCIHMPIHMPAHMPTRKSAHRCIHMSMHMSAHTSVLMCVWQVKNIDCIQAALKLRRRGMSPVLLSFANPHHPGVDAQMGACGVEAELFRRTNIHMHLAERARAGTLSYPLGAHECVLSHDVLVLRGGEAEGYAFLTPPMFISVVSAAPYERAVGAVYPASTPAAADEIREAWADKIATLLVQAIANLGLIRNIISYGNATVT